VDRHPVPLGDGGINLLQELDELLLAVPPVALADHLARRHVQGRE